VGVYEAAHTPNRGNQQRMLRHLGVPTGLDGISPGLGLPRYLGVQAGLHDILSEARMG
jgi:hypothetical protein